MKQGLSAVFYLKNNRRRTAVLVVSLGLFVAMLYVLAYMISSTTSVYYDVWMTQTKTTQIILPELQVTEEMGTKEEQDAAINSQIMELSKKVESLDCVEKVIPARFIFPEINVIIGDCYINCPLVEPNQIDMIMRHSNATLAKGKMPQNAGDILIDELTAQNQDLKIGDNIYSSSYKVVGIVSCESYFTTGIATGTEDRIGTLIFSEGENVDFMKLYKTFHLPYDYLYISDNASAAKEYKDDIVSEFDFATNIIKIVSTLLLAICLVVVFNMYIRDRYEEWCLYSSMGYSTSNIFGLAFRELLITFGLAAILGGIVSGVGVILLKKIMIDEMGLLSTPIMLSEMGNIGGIIVAIFGIFLIPIFLATQRIKTIDAMESEEW